MENNEQTTQQPQESAQPELTVNDLNALRSVIDVAVRRGTFNANEISSVGAVYDKLNTFLNAVAKQASAETK
jgi:uncharacterized protein YggE